MASGFCLEPDHFSGLNRFESPVNSLIAEVFHRVEEQRPNV